MIKLSATVQVGDLKGALLRAAMPELLRAAQQTGLAAVRNITANAASEFQGGHRSRGGVSLSSSAPYTFTITRSALGPKITFRVHGNQQFMAKFKSQNYGSSAHVIAPKRKKALAFEGRNQPFRGSAAARAAQGTHPVKGSINHPGTTGRHFYERGVEEAIAAFPGLLS